MFKYSKQIFVMFFLLVLVGCNQNTQVKEDKNIIEIYKDYTINDDNKMSMKISDIKILEDISGVLVDGSTLYLMHDVLKDGEKIGVNIEESSFDQFKLDEGNRYIGADLYIKTKNGETFHYANNKELYASIILLNPLKINNVLLFSVADSFLSLRDEKKKLIYHIKTKELIETTGDLFLAEDESQILCVSGYNKASWPSFEESEFTITLFLINSLSIDESFNKTSKNYGIYNVKYRDDKWYFDEGTAFKSEWDSISKPYFLKHMVLLREDDDFKIYSKKESLIEHISVYNERNIEKLLYEDIRMESIYDIKSNDYYGIIDNELYLWFEGIYNGKKVYFNRKLREDEEPSYSGESIRKNVENIHFITDSSILDYNVNEERRFFKVLPFLSDIGYFTVYDEWNSTWSFINKKTGKRYDFYGDISLSEENNRFILSSDYPNEEHFISILTCNELDIDVVTIKSEEEWTPTNIKWTNKNEITFDASYKDEKKSYIIKYSNSTFTLYNNEDARLIID